MKIKISVKEFQNKGGAAVVLNGKEYGVGWERKPFDNAFNKKWREIGINAIKARCILELMKAEKGIEIGQASDGMLTSTDENHKLWMDLTNKIDFEIT